MPTALVPLSSFFTHLKDQPTSIDSQILSLYAKGMTIREMSTFKCINTMSLWN
ncbi:hypothetical protein [Providencia stuartii]|uniref:hypothetical protein n=1 Tax=Providencia stuartii TaxID=588 RepID=UPI0038576CEC